MEPVKNNICVLGSANVDFFVYVNHIPVPGQTIQADNYMTANGGKGANQAVAVGKLINPENTLCTFIGQVGQDDEMRSLKKQMTEAKVNLNWIEKQNISTGKAFIYVDQNSGQNSIVIVGGANMSYNKLDSVPQQYIQSLSNCKYLLLQKEIPMEIDLLAAKLTNSKGCINIMDCGGRDDQIPQQLIANIHFISPNQTQLLRIDSTIKFDNKQLLVNQIRQKLINKYPNLKVLLKLGSKGSAMVTGKLYIEAPVPSKLNAKVSEDYQIVDTVGAGDCFTGAFTVKYSEIDWSDQSKDEQNYRKAMLFANCSAFLCITKKGAMPSMPLRKDVDQFMAKYDIK